MATRIRFGHVATLRAGVADASRYEAPRALHLPALWLAAGIPLLGILILIGAR